MKIAAVHATPLTARFADLYGGADRIPAQVLRPASHFTGVPRVGQYTTLVTVTAEDGSTGHGEAWGLPLPEATAMWINRLIAPAVVGRDCDDISGVFHDLTDYFGRIGHSASIAMEAVSGLDLALWDLRGRRLGQSVSRLLGRRRDAIDCYVSPVMFSDKIADARAAARAFVDEGFDALKLKAGRGVDRDLADAQAVRDEVGPDVGLLVDVNGAYDLEEATRLVQGLEPIGVVWVEEPMPPARLGDLPALKSRSGVRIAMGENEFTLGQFEQMLDSGADVIMPNVTRAGGITGCLAIADMVQRRGADFSLHGVGSGVMMHASLQLLAALETPALFEVNRFPNPLRDSLTPPAQRVDGRLLAADGPGLGLDIDPVAVERFGRAA